MRQPSKVERLNNSDRKKIRRIFLQMASIYMSLILIAIGGVAAKSMHTVRPGTSLSKNANLP